MSSERVQAKREDPAAVWGPRLCAAAPVCVAAAVITGVFDSNDRDSPVAAIAFVIAFLGVACALFGGFMCLFAAERVPGFVRPKWATACAIIGIAGGFGAGLLALIT